MRLYIDKENVWSFMSLRNKDIDLFDESVRLIKKGMIVHYNFPKDDILKDPVLTAWFGRMKGAGVMFSSEFCPDATVKPERPIKTNFYINYNTEDKASVYLLNIEEGKCNIIRDKKSILIGKLGDEMEVFKALLDIPDRPRMMNRIGSWADYCPQIPLTDVILCDNHYFKNIYVYKKNNHELIRALATIPKDSFSVVIFTKEGEIDKGLNLEDECKKIKELITSTSHLTKKKCAVTIITTNKTHSRHIITNYYRVSPTSCVHLKDNGLKDDANIVIEPHTDPQAVETTKQLVSMFQKIAFNPVQIFGDKSSNFLKFNL